MFDGPEGCPVFYGVSMTVLFRSVTESGNEDFILALGERRDEIKVDTSHSHR
jgi:hypothetical protein